MELPSFSQSVYATKPPPAAADRVASGCAIAGVVLVLVVIALLVWLIVILFGRRPNRHHHHHRRAAVAVITPATSQELEDALARGDVVLVFVSSGCPWCRKFEPVVAEVAAMVETPIVRVDVSTPHGAALAQKHNVEGVPTCIRSGRVYEGDRSAESFRAFAA